MSEIHCIFPASREFGQFQRRVRSCLPPPALSLLRTSFSGGKRRTGGAYLRRAGHRQVAADGRAFRAHRRRAAYRHDLYPRRRPVLMRETLVWAGQTAGGVREILPVAEIMRRLVDETEAALARAPALH